MCWSWSLEGKHLEGSFINLFLKVYLYEFLLGTSFNIKVIYINSYKHYFASKGPSSHSHSLAMVFPVVMYGCESWTVKKAERRRIDAFELWWKTLESPLDCKEIQPVHSEGDEPWMFFGRNDAKAETPVLWPPHAKT